MDLLNCEGLETPCIVVDHKKALENIRKMQQTADRLHVDLRPHIKTHKMPFYARLQIQAGAHGITCAKVSEAEVMADGGIDDIFIAYPIIDRPRMERTRKLMNRCRRLILGVDSLGGAAALNRFAREHGIVFEVRMEVDTGARRTGICMDEAVALASAIRTMDGLNLTGIYTFKSMVLRGAPCTDLEAAGREEGALLRELRIRLEQSGIHLREISAGSTPTAESAARTGEVTEIRPGTYLFHDDMTVREGAAREEEIAACYIATVVSTPCEEYAVLDGGTKMFSTDIRLHEPPYYYESYARVDGRPDLVLERLNEEHGMLVSRTGNTGLSVGQRIKLVPLHVCTAVNLQNRIYIDRGDYLESVPVGARGMVV